MNDKEVEDLKHKEVLKLLSQAICPFYITFKKSQKRIKKENKHIRDIQEYERKAKYVYSDYDEILLKTQLN